jgi:hypothetical protein
MLERECASTFGLAFCFYKPITSLFFSLFSIHHATKIGTPPPPPAGDEEDECVSNKEVRSMTKAMTGIFMKNQQSTDTTLERVQRSIAGIIDRVDALVTGMPPTDQAKLPNETCEDDYNEEEEVEDEEPFNPPCPPP